MKLKWNYFAYDDAELELAFSLSLSLKRVKIVRTWLVFVLIFVIVRSILLLSYNEERTVSNIVLFCFWVTLPLSILIGSYYILPTYARYVGFLSHAFFYLVLVLAIISLLLDDRGGNEPPSFIATTAVIWVAVPFTATLLIQLDMVGIITSCLISFFVVMFLFSLLDTDSDQSFVSSRSWVLVLGFISFFLLFIAAFIHAQQTRFTFYARKKFIEEHDARTAEQAAVSVASQKMEFISQVAHDIGTPLQALSLCIDELRQSMLTNHQSGIVDDQVTAMDLLISTRNKALSYAKADNAGTFTPSIAVVDVKKLLQKCRRVMELYMVNKDVKLVFQIQKSLLDDKGNMFILSDCEFLRDMLLNYLSNAAKFTDRGEINVTIFKSIDEFLRFEVRDSGIGVSDDNKRKLFMAFSQVTNGSMDIDTITHKKPNWFDEIEAIPDGTSSRSIHRLVSNASQSVSTLLHLRRTTNDLELGINDSNPTPARRPVPSKNGTGLGLFGVKVKATSLGGSVGVEDNYPAGSVFYFTMPYKSCDEFGHIARDVFAENVNIMASDDLSLNIGNSRPTLRKSATISSRWRRDNNKDDDSLVNDLRFVEIRSVKHLPSPKMTQPETAIDVKPTTRAITFFQPEALLGSSDIEMKSIDKPIRVIRQASLSKQLIQEPTPVANLDSAVSSSMSTTSSDVKSLEVLLVEDSSSVRMMMSKSLKRRNIAVDEAEDGQIGLDKLKVKEYEIAIFDNYMPNMNGIDAVVKFRAWEEEQMKSGGRVQRQRLAMMTGAIDDDFIIEATSSGAECVLSKPTPVDKLMSLINNRC